MSEEQLRQLQRQLWNIADTLRGKMNADEFRDYILGFIFYKYLSEKVVGYANQFILSEDGLDYAQLNEQDEEGAEIVEIVKDSLVKELDYFLKPSELFCAIALRSKSDSKGQGYVLDDLQQILKNIEQSTLDTDSADDFSHLFEDLDLTSTKLGKTADDRNELVAKVIQHLDAIEFDLNNTESDVRGNAYE